LAGYSGTPLPKKLGIGERSRVALIAAPEDFGRVLGPVPPSVEIAEGAKAAPGKGPFDVIVMFVRSRAELQRGFAPAAEKLQPAGGLWVAWPKKASGVKTDMTEDVAREVGLPAGLVDNKVCAIDETWSGLRFVYRVKDRPAPARKR
jgi:hypothetical protein